MEIIANKKFLETNYLRCRASRNSLRLSIIKKISSLFMGLWVKIREIKNSTENLIAITSRKDAKHIGNSNQEILTKRKEKTSHKRKLIFGVFLNLKADLRTAPKSGDFTERYQQL